MNCLLANRLLLTALVALLPNFVAAETYPSRLVHLINPFAVGGPTDLLARTVGQQLSEAWGQPVVVEARPGAAGSIGVKYVAEAPADGYMLLVMPTGTAVVNPHLYPKLPYDTFSDFTPVALLATEDNVLVVSPDLKVRSMQDLIVMARANPGKLSFASPGVGSQAHIAGELLKSMAGVDMLHVPYKGMAPAMNDLLGGHVSFMFLTMSTALSQVQAGRLKPLGVASQVRSSAAPDLPTIAEQGLSDFKAVSWYALMAPAGTPAEVVRKIADECARALREPRVAERLRALGLNPVGSSSPELAALLRREHAFWGKFVRRTGIRAE